MPSQTQAPLIDRIVELRPVLRRRAALLIGGRSQIGTPDDFVQDTIVTALQGLHRFEDDNLTGWLVTILHGQSATPAGLHMSARRFSWPRQATVLTMKRMRWRFPSVRRRNIGSMWPT